MVIEMAEVQAKMTGQVISNHAVIIIKPVRDVLGIEIGDYVELTVRKLEPVKNEAKEAEEPENKELVEVKL